MSTEPDIDRLLRQAATLEPTFPTCVAPADIDEQALLGYVENTLDRRTRERVREHLVRCSFCREVQRELVSMEADDAPIVRARSSTHAARRLWPIAAAAAVLLTGVGVMSGRALIVPARPGEHSLVVEGARAATRGPATAHETPPHFVPSSQLEITITADTPPLALLLVVARVEGASLVPIEVTTSRRRDVDGESFRFEARGDDLFGRRRGRQKLLFLLADERSALDGVFELSPDEVEDREGVRVLEYEADYDPEAYGHGAALFGAEYLVRVEDQVEPAFSSAHGPVVRVRGHAGDQWTLVFELESGERVTSTVKAEARGRWTLLRPDEAPGLLGRGTLRLMRGAEPFASWPARWVTPPASRPRLREAVRLRQAGLLDAAGTELRRQLEGAEGEARLWLLTELGRVEYRAGSSERATAAWQDAIEVAEQLGITSEVSARTRAIAYLSIQDGRFAEAFEALERARRLDARTGNDQGLARADYLMGFATKRAGIGRVYLEARQLYEDAIESSYLRGADDDVYRMTELLGTLLAENGHFIEALELLERNPPTTAQPLDHAQYLSNLSWIRYCAMQAGLLEWDFAKIKEERTQVFDILERLGVPKELANAKARLALAAVRVGESKEAELLLSELRHHPADELTWVRNLVPQLRAELAIRRGDSEAAIQLLEPIVGALAAGVPREREEATALRVLLADARRHQGDLEGAIRDYSRSIEEAEALARRFVAPRSADHFHMRWRHAYGALAQSLLGSGRVEEAWGVAERLARGRLAALSAQVEPARHPDKWRRYREALLEHRGSGCDERGHGRECTRSARRVEAALEALFASSTLASGEPGVECREHLAPGQLYLSVTRGAEGWLSFLYDADGQVVARSDGDYLEAWEPRLRAASAVFVSSGGHQPTYDLPVQAHAGGPPLGALVPMSFVPSCDALGIPAPEETGRRLLVADPEGDLPTSRDEARQVMAAVGNAELLLGELATKEAVLERWATLDLFHYAGHGAVDDRGLGTTLRTAGSPIRVFDVLMSRPRIRSIVLNGCRTGLHGEALVNALLLSGAQSIVSTSEDIPEQPQDFLQVYYLKRRTNPAGVAFQKALKITALNGVDRIPYRIYGRAEL